MIENYKDNFIDLLPKIALICFFVGGLGLGIFLLASGIHDLTSKYEDNKITENRQCADLCWEKGYTYSDYLGQDGSGDLLCKCIDDVRVFKINNKLNNG